jgi:hypothetical protein
MTLLVKDKHFAQYTELKSRKKQRASPEGNARYH